MLDQTSFETIGFGASDFVSLALYLILGLYTIFTGILYYHWKNFGTDTKMTNLTFILYFSTTLPLILIMIIMALTI